MYTQTTIWKKNKLVYSLLLFLLIFCSCNDSEGPGIMDEEETVEAYFSLKNPMIVTKSMDEQSEMTLSTIDILIFKEENGEEYYAYRSSADIVSITDSIKFKSTLYKSNDLHRLVVLTNVRDILDKFGSFSTQAKKDDVLAILEIQNKEGWNANSPTDFTPIPMWGEYNKTIQIEENLDIHGLTLLKSLVRMDIELSPIAQEVFTLKEVYLYNSNIRGRVAPAPDSWVVMDGKLIVTVPTLPENKNDLRNKDSIKYVATNPTKLTQTIYTFETAAPGDGFYQEATCLIIGGEYKDDGFTTYYRADLLKTGYQENTSTPTAFKDILRNHCYVFNITAVKESGYHTPDSAFRYKKADLVVEVTTWSDMADISDGGYDGEYIFNLSTSNITLRQDNNYYGYIKIECNYPEGWSIVSSPSFLNVTKIDNNNLEMRLRSGGTGQSGTITLSVGNLEKTIKVSVV